MKKITLIVLAALFVLPLDASKLSQFLHKQKDRTKAREQKERQLDLRFSDYSFRLERRYRTQEGQTCRVYMFRSRTTPFRQGNLVVCDE